jgi:epoxyqueuosine reductase
VNPPLERLASLTRDEFNQAFRGSPIKRAKYAGFRRNVAIAIGNSGDPTLLSSIEPMLSDDDPAVRSAAEHARQKLSSRAAATSD